MVSQIDTLIAEEVAKPGCAVGRFLSTQAPADVAKLKKALVEKRIYVTGFHRIITKMDATVSRHAVRRHVAAILGDGADPCSCGQKGWL